MIPLGHSSIVVWEKGGTGRGAGGGCVQRIDAR